MQLALAVGVAHAQAPPGSGEGDPAGGYRLEHTVWPDAPDCIPHPSRLPDRLELTADPFLIGAILDRGPIERVSPPGLDGAHTVRDGGLPDRGGNFSYWPFRESELVLGRHHRTARLGFRLVPAGEDWVGTLTGFTDFIPEDGDSSVDVSARLIRERCPPQ